MANNLMHFDPFNELSRTGAFRGLENFMKSFQLRSMLGDLDAEPRIKIDVTEDQDKYTVKADIPGVRKEDIDIDIRDNEIAISAELHREKEEKSGEVTVCSERYYGKQYRSFTLPQEINEANVSATYENGVLQIALPKKPGSSSKKVTIN